MPRPRRASRTRHASLRGEETIGSAVAFVFPAVPHQRCQFHYLKDATEPLYEADGMPKRS